MTLPAAFSVQPSWSGKDVRASPLIRLAHVLVDIATVALRAGRYEQAETMLRSAQILWPACPVLEQMKTTALVYAGRYGEALESSADNTDSFSLAFRAACLLKLKVGGWEEVAMRAIAANDCAEGVTLAMQLLAINREPWAALHGGTFDQDVIFYNGVKA